MVGCLADHHVVITSNQLAKVFITRPILASKSYFFNYLIKIVAGFEFESPKHKADTSDHLAKNFRKPSKRVWLERTETILDTNI